MATGEDRQPETLEQRAARIVPGGDNAELAKHYEEDPALNRLRAESIASHQLAVAAVAAALRNADAWRDAVVARLSQEPLTIREATVGGSDQRAVTTTEGV
jgi:hypothetical protein